MPARRGSCLDSTPFTLGVASGDPTAESIIIWTRIAPEPLAPGAGAPPSPVRMRWAIYDSPDDGKIVASGKTLSLPQWGHSIHVDVEGLEPRSITLIHLADRKRIATTPEALTD